MPLELFPESSIFTERTFIRKYVPEDVHSILFFLKRNMDRLKEHFPLTISMVSDENTSLDFIFLRTVEWDQNISFTYGIYLKVTNEYIGQITIKRIEWDKKEAELGYFIDERYEGKGIMTEVMLTVEMQCRKLGIKCLQLRIIPGNIKSIKLAEKFRYENSGILTENFQSHDGKMINIILYTKMLL
ncbi:GNAT family N-acetyltransferase [soil metagenome]